MNGKKIDLGLTAYDELFMDDAAIPFFSMLLIDYLDRLKSTGSKRKYAHLQRQRDIRQYKSKNLRRLSREKDFIGSVNNADLAVRM